MLRRIALHPFVVSLLLAGTAVTTTPVAASAEPMRAVQADLDYVYDPDPVQTERNIDHFVERIAQIQPAAVFLQGFADPKGTGLASELYFPNRVLPMRADLFNRVVTELKDRTHVAVYGWLPVLSFQLSDKVTPVVAWSPRTKTAEVDPKAYHRVSPFDATARADVIHIYEDMAKAAPIDGILFHDDAMLSDFEDASPVALKAYKAAGLPDSIEALRADPKTFKAWTNFKTDTLIAFTNKLTSRVRHYRPDVKTARNIYAPVMLNGDSVTWFAQDYAKFLKAYDYTAVEAMPRMEKVADTDSTDWMQKLVAVGAGQPSGLSRTIFELQAVDWNLEAAGKDRAIADETLEAEMRLLIKQGAVNLGYYPDDYVTDTPKLALLRKDFSLQNDQTP